MVLEQHLTSPQREAWGKYFLSLLTDWSWIRRRVTSVRIVDNNRVESRVSVDVDVKEIKTRASAAGIALDSTRKELPVPLDILEKGLVPDFDINGTDGCSTSLATSDENALVWQEVIIAAINSRVPPNPPHFDDQFRTELRAIVRPMITMRSLQRTVRDGTKGFNRRVLEIQSHQSSKLDAWLALLCDPLASDLLALAVVNYIPIIYVSIDQNCATIKYRTMNTSRRPRLLQAYGLFRDHRADVRAILAPLLEINGSVSFRLARTWLRIRNFLWVPGWFLFLLARVLGRYLTSRMGIRALRQTFELQSIGRAQREHSRYIAPAGVEICTEPRIDLDALSREDQESLVVSVGKEDVGLAVRTTPERASIYTRGWIELQSRLGSGISGVPVQINMRACGSGFIHSFFAVCVVNLAINLAVSHATWDDLSKYTTPQDAIVTVLLFGSSLFSAFAVRSDEHALKSSILNPLRTIIALAGGLTGLSGFGIALDWEGLYVYSHIAAIWLSCISIVVTSVFLAMRAYDMVRVRARMRDTRNYFVSRHGMKVLRSARARLIWREIWANGSLREHRIN